MSTGNEKVYFTYYPAPGEIQLSPGSGIHMEVSGGLFPVVKWLYKRLANIGHPVDNVADSLKRYLTLDDLYVQSQKDELCGVGPEAIADAAIILVKLGVAEFKPARYSPNGGFPLRVDFALVPKRPMPLINQLVWD